jgi:hypothetical protein
MVLVQENMAKLTPDDRKAIAAYLKSLPPRPDAVRRAARGKRRRAIDLGFVPAGARDAGK